MKNHRFALPAACFLLAVVMYRNLSGDEAKPARVSDGLDGHRLNAARVPIQQALKALHSLVIEDSNRFLSARFLRVVDRWQRDPLFVASQRFLAEGAYDRAIGWVGSELTPRGVESLWVAENREGGAVAVWSSSSMSVVATLSAEEIRELQALRSRVAKIVGEKTRLEGEENLFDGSYTLCMVIDKDRETCLFTHGFRNQEEEKKLFVESEKVMHWIRKRTKEPPFASRDNAHSRD